MAAPAAPTNLVATDGTLTTGVSNTWTKSATATAYKVYRNTANDSGTSTLIDTLGDVAVYLDTSAVIQTLYYYWVTAGNIDGYSTYSTGDSGWRIMSGGTNAGIPPSCGWIVAGSDTYVTIIAARTGTDYYNTLSIICGTNPAIISLDGGTTDNLYIPAAVWVDLPVPRLQGAIAAKNAGAGNAYANLYVLASIQE
jgi:hypothetical protein